MQETASVAASVQIIKNNDLNKPQCNFKIPDCYGSVSCEA